MKKRCHNPKDRNYPEYGAKGIQVCPKWRSSFKAFLTDMGPRPSPQHTIDRMDNSLGYQPSNCRWATKQQQARNRPTFVKSVNGKTVVEVAEDLATVPAPTLYNRVRAGMSIEKVLHKGRLPSGAPPRLLTLQGETLPLRTWAKRLGIKCSTVRERLKRGWTVQRALTPLP